MELMPEPFVEFDQLVDQLAHQVAAEHLADVRRRHLARTEALELHLRPDFLDPLVQLCLELRGRHRNGECAAETFCLGLGNFHRFFHPFAWVADTKMRADALRILSEGAAYVIAESPCPRGFCHYCSTVIEGAEPAVLRGSRLRFENSIAELRNRAALSSFQREAQRSGKQSKMHLQTRSGPLNQILLWS